MNTNENILEQLKTLQLGPTWDSNQRPQQITSSESTFRDGKKRRVPRVQQKNSNPQKPPILQDIVVSFRPQEVALQTLVRSLKESHKTYQLFSIATLFLEKPERFMINLSAKDHNNPEKGFFYALPGNWPFLTEEEAFQHALKTHMDEYFERSTVTTEKPKGNFQCVNQCGLTGKLLGPPNYHRYTDLIKEHFSLELEKKCTFEAFLKAIKTLKEPEMINQWLEQMCTVTRYVLKSDTSQVFESQEAVRRYAYNNYKTKWVSFVRSAKITGNTLANLPSDTLKQTIEATWEHEKRFPLETANFLRGRLHHFGFHLYKKGKKGISFVCAVKRKIRDENTHFSTSIQALIEFIEKSPNMLVCDLAKKYLNLGDNPPQQELVTNNDFKQLQLDLHWLIAEGYVTEYEDGRLYVTPVQKHSMSTDGSGKTSQEEDILSESEA